MICTTYYVASELISFGITNILICCNKGVRQLPCTRVQSCYTCVWHRVYYTLCTSIRHSKQALFPHTYTLFLQNKTYNTTRVLSIIHVPPCLYHRGQVSCHWYKSFYGLACTRRMLCTSKVSHQLPMTHRKCTKVNMWGGTGLSELWFTICEAEGVYTRRRLLLKMNEADYLFGTRFLLSISINCIVWIAWHTFWMEKWKVIARNNLCILIARVLKLIDLKVHKNWIWR